MCCLKVDAYSLLGILLHGAVGALKYVPNTQFVQGVVGYDVPAG